MIKLNINYGNLVTINCLCTEEQAEILDHYFYGLIQPGFVDNADFTLTYGGNINQRQMKDPSKWKICKTFRNPEYYCYDTGNNTRIAYSTDETFNSKHIVVRKKDQIRFYDQERPGDTLAAAIVREMVVRTLLKHKFFPMHSASFSDGKNAAIIFGHRKAGKSSTMIYETICKGHNMVANDIQFVGKLNGQWTCASIPYDVTVGSDLLNAIGVPAPESEKKLRFTPKQFCEQFGVGQQWLAPIKCMINTKLDLNRSDYTISRIDEIDRAELYEGQSREEEWEFDDPYLMSGEFVFDYDGLAKDVPLIRVEGRLLNYFEKFSIDGFDYSKISGDDEPGDGNAKQ